MYVRYVWIYIFVSMEFHRFVLILILKILITGIKTLRKSTTHAKSFHYWYPIYMHYWCRNFNSKDKDGAKLRFDLVRPTSEYNLIIISILAYLIGLYIAVT